MHEKQPKGSHSNKSLHFPPVVKRPERGQSPGWVLGLLGYSQASVLRATPVLIFFSSHFLASYIEWELNGNPHTITFSCVFLGSISLKMEYSHLEKGNKTW